MKASEAGLLSFLKKANQFVIPIYQRNYSWTEAECRQLWSDIVRAGADENVPSHFIGSIVYIDKGFAVHWTPLLVIDGQQRLTTAALLIAALAEALDALPEDEREVADGFSPNKLRNYYLVNPEETAEKYFKLLLSQTDRSTLCAVVSGKPLPPAPQTSIRIVENLDHFRGWLAAPSTDLAAVCRGLAKLTVVDIALSRDHDNPQLIFESMNSTGRELSQADLIRNYVLMGQEPKTQTDLYERYWHPMERVFGQRAYGEQFDAFVRHFLTVRTGTIPNIREVYAAFKQYAGSKPVAEAGTGALLADLLRTARHFCAMALGTEPDKALGRAFADLRELRVDVAYPFLLELYDLSDRGVLARDDFAAAARLVEAYVFRRAVCGIPTNSLNRTFTTLTRSLDPARLLESLQAAFQMMPSYRRFPDDEEFARELEQRDLSNQPRRTYLLRRLENHGKKEPAEVNAYTVEHILPQNPNLSAAWRRELGPDWQRVQQQWLHTLGNLTLTGYNSEYSDKPFEKKRDMAGGFAQSPLTLNQGLGQVERWDEAAIRQRADRLARRALAVWPAPSLPADVVDRYRSTGAGKSSTIEDWPQLAGGPARDLFDALRREVFTLDPGVVTEEFFKHYIAYKAETNFVDMAPQTKQVKLWLNMPFEELEDPRGTARDVSMIGHHGNGDVEVVVASLDAVPYAVGLIRQSYERQMGVAIA